MTIQEAFEKAAMDRFNEVKMAGMGDMFRQLGGMQGLKNIATGGMKNILPSITSAYSALDPAAKTRLMQQVGGMVAGGVGGYMMSDKDSSFLKKMRNAALGAGGGYGAVRYGPGLYNRFANAAPAAAPAAVA